MTNTTASNDNDGMPYERLLGEGAVAAFDRLCHEVCNTAPSERKAHMRYTLAFLCKEVWDAHEQHAADFHDWCLTDCDQPPMPIAS